MIARYRALFSAPGVGRLLVSSMLGRLPAGMFSLAILLFVHGRTGSFLAAGLAVGAFSHGGRPDRPAAGGAGRSARADARAAGSRGLPGGAAGRAGARRPGRCAGGGDRRAGGARGRRHSRRSRAACARCGRRSPTARSSRPPTRSTRPPRRPSGRSARCWWGSAAGFVSPAAAVLLCAALTVCGTVYFATSTTLPRLAARRAQAHAGQRAHRRPQPARAALHGRARGSGDRSGRGRAARAGGAAGRALVGRPAARPVQPREHGRRPDLLREELGAADRLGATAWC